MRILELWQVKLGSRTSTLYKRYPGSIMLLLDTNFAKQFRGIVAILTI